ncbi:DEAD-box ATP-dependent RNA helicase 20-like isoform X2 [Scaptodrosophila lebanonensis]|uniref:DEAD-box ATP-dependent RNA helicase 20-like isoform X2 n=1 Tax=Drosophila lebanonensis TaxID=7225 RepID=A0A6J2U2Z3_DROLE|nr:DEAD-box ATP-dependent RNA helicase 20-like isoform X2 [Scaptodrosophila lebanonensis]
MSSAITSESEIDLCSVDMLRRPIKTRSYYNSNNSRNLLRSVETRTTKNSPKGPISWRRQSKDNLWVTATPPNNKSIKEGLAQKRPSMEPVAQLAFGSAPQSNACKKRRSQMVFTSQPKAKSTGSVESSTLLPLATRSSPPLPSPETFQYRKSIDISSNDIGPILGRGGCTIAHIEREYKVSVNLDRHRLLVTVRGCEETQVVSAIADIRKIIKNNTPGAGNFVGGQQIMPLPQSSKLPATNWRSPSFRRSTTDTNATSRTRLSSDVLRAPATEPAVYNEAPEVTALTEQAVIDMRAENDNTMVSVVLNPGASSQNGGDDEQQPHPVIPRPIWLFDQAFAQYGNNWSTLLGERFERPTPIQAQAWPILLQGLDLIGVAQTGTGKTLAYLLPALIQTERQIRVCSGPGPHVLVLVPTRELAAQIDKEMQTFKSSSLRSVLIVGGGDRRAQIDSRSAHFIIGTPGRLIDMLDSHQLNIGRVTFLVLDEADRMLDMGFEHQIKKILRALRTTHQTVMTSATWPQEVRRLARMLTRNPIQVCVGTQHLSTTHSVKQTVCVIQDHDKFPLVAWRPPIK